MVRVPTPEDEDAKRIHRERENLVQEKLRIENRIEALLFTLEDYVHRATGQQSVTQSEDWYKKSICQ